MRNSGRMLRCGALLWLSVTAATTARAQRDAAGERRDCDGLPSTAQLRAALAEAPHPLTPAPGSAGGLFGGTRMWGAVVNRDGRICAFGPTADVDPRDVWPGSQAIAKAKAYTANAFSRDALALSTARLYTFSQPGHSLWGLNQSNPFDPDCLAPIAGVGGGLGRICAGIITFGGGVPLYHAGKIIGGLGVSGDTACTDHEIAKRVRAAFGLNPPGGAGADDIVYSPPDPESVFAHPVCVNTRRDNEFIGNEAPARYPVAP